MRILAFLALLALLCGGASAQQNSGVAVYQANALSSTTVTIKGRAGGLSWFQCANPSDATAYLQFFDTTSAVTPGTTVPKFALPVATVAVHGASALQVTMFAAIKVLAAKTPTGSAAPSAALNCAFGFY